MPDITTTVDASAVGFDPDRLERITSKFDVHVKEGRLPGWLCAVGRDGEVAWVGAGGHRNVELELPSAPDTIWRIYSMTKPITSMAAMMLHEEGCFDLNDEVAQWIPEFGDLRVYVEGPPEAPVTRPTSSPLRVWHLLTHTAGLTYGFQQCQPSTRSIGSAGTTSGPAGHRSGDGGGRLRGDAAPIRTGRGVELLGRHRRRRPARRALERHALRRVPRARGSSPHSGWTTRGSSATRDRRSTGWPSSTSTRRATRSGRGVR